MTLGEIRELHTLTRTHGRSTGPTTERGKLRASLNAVTHGLAAVHVLLPGEDGADYEAKMDAVFVALDPKNDGEAQLVALLGDDLWRLQRLNCVEQALLLGRIEELLAQTGATGDATSIIASISTLGSALIEWEAKPFPKSEGLDLYRRVRHLADALRVVALNQPEVAADDVERCWPLVEELSSPALPGEIESAGGELFSAARRVLQALLQVGESFDVKQDDLRKAIATIALPAEAEIKKLARYRRLIEDGLQRRLAVLEQMKKLSASSPVTEADVEKAREYRVRLRVVR